MDPNKNLVVDGSGLRRLTRRGDAPPRWSPGGRNVLFTDGYDHLARGTYRGWNGIFVLSQDGRRITRLVRLSGTADKLEITSVTWSPDGKRIGYANRSGIHILDLARKRDRLIPASRQELCFDLDWPRHR